MRMASHSSSRARSAAAESVLKYGIAGAGGADDDAPLLQVADGAAPDVGLAHGADLDGAHDPRVDALVLQGVLEREGVLHGGHHADVVAGGAVHAAGGGGHPAKDVAAADDDGDVDVEARGRS